MSDATIDEICAVACAEAWRGDGEVLASPAGGIIPSVGAALAKLTFEPDLLLTDGESGLLARPTALGAPAGERIVEGYLTYRSVFDVVWSGRRHVMMGASQIDRFGNQNISNIGPWDKPRAQLIGARGSPGNTVNHATSYWVPAHSKRVFVDKVDFISGVGYDRQPRSRFLALRRVITNLCVLDFETPDGAMRLRSRHPGVSLAEVLDNTGFALVAPENPEVTREPAAEELRLIREVIDPAGLRKRELGG